MATTSSTAELWSPAQEVERRIRAEILEPGPSSTAPAAEGLHICPSCRGPFVVPGDDFDPDCGRFCRMELICVECGWETTGLYTEDEVEQLDREMDRGYADMLWALEVLWIGNEEDAIARFASALGAGAILPEDF